jgi:molybdate-binding protein
LEQYLKENDFKPSIYVHRGHSYHVKSTMQRIQPSAKIVVLGSCGGYNNIKEVLGISEDAHIISSKQTGTMNINEPIIQSILQTVIAEKDISWVNLWKDLAARFQSGDAKDKFDDYIPPYKNLGAIFIKAYNHSILSSGNNLP